MNTIEIKTARTVFSMKLSSPISNSRNKKQVSEINYFIKYYKNVTYKIYNNNLHVICFEVEVKVTDQLMMAWFWGNSGKASGFYRYSDDQKRNARINQLKGQSLKQIEVDQKRAVELANRKILANAAAAAVEVGDLYSSSWGYEQTNVDFYQVIERPSALYAIVQSISYSVVHGSEYHDSCKVLPMKDSLIGEPFRVKLNGSNFKVKSYSYASPTTQDCEHYKSWGY